MNATPPPAASWPDNGAWCLHRSEQGGSGDGWVGPGEGREQETTRAGCPFIGSQGLSALSPRLVSSFAQTSHPTVSLTVHWHGSMGWSGGENVSTPISPVYATNPISIIGLLHWSFSNASIYRQQGSHVDDCHPPRSGSVLPPVPEGCRGYQAPYQPRESRSHSQNQNTAWASTAHCRNPMLDRAAKCCYSVASFYLV